MSGSTAVPLNIEDYIVIRREELNRWFKAKMSGRSDRFLIERVFEGGKRLRPLLLLMVFEALGGTNREAALDVAFALELAHNASLVHDDILDWDKIRRGKPTLWRQLGISRAIIEGHRIINLAFQTVLEKGVEISRLFLEAWDKASFGVLEEMFSTTPPAKKLYLRIIQEKTASLFAVGAEVAAVLANATWETRVKAREYGLLVGTAYQLADDYVELKRGGGIVRVLLRLQQIEDLIRRGYLTMRSGRLLKFLKSATQLTNLTPYISSEMNRTLTNVDKIVEEMQLKESYKALLKQFPRYCIREMLKEGRVREEI